MQEVVIIKECQKSGVLKMSEKRFKIDTTSEIGHIYINNQDGEHMSWIEVENTLNEQQATIKSKDKQLERLYNYFQDYLKDEMSGNAFSEMWDNVKEDERWNDE